MPNMGANIIYEFLKDNNQHGLKFFLGVCFFLQCAIIALVIARAIIDDLDYAVAVAVINTINSAYLVFDLWLFGFSQSTSLTVVLISDSICTAANILICLVGVHSVRVISFFVLALSFILKAIVVSFMLSTLIGAIDKWSIGNGHLQSQIYNLDKRAKTLEQNLPLGNMNQGDNLISGDVFVDD